METPKLDMTIDPATLDFVDTDDGGWEETDSSTTAVLCQLESDYAKWWGDPRAGSRIRELMQNDEGTPVEAVQLRDEAQRALQVLVNDGVLSELAAEVLENDEGNRATIGLRYTDRASGRSVDQVYTPLVPR